MEELQYYVLFQVKPIHFAFMVAMCIIAWYGASGLALYLCGMHKCDYLCYEHGAYTGLVVLLLFGLELWQFSPLFLTRLAWPIALVIAIWRFCFFWKENRHIEI